MQRILSFISKNHNYKMVIGILIGLIIAGTSAYAITVAGNTVTYDNTNSKLSATNVQNAIDELYVKSNTLKSTVELYRNSNIVKVMGYDDDSTSSNYCVTGNEATCEELTPKKTETYAQGTIIDYKVNSSTIRRFYVIHDEGTKLTLQDQKNTVDRVAYATKEDYIAAGGTESEWNSCTDASGETGCSTRGPLTILPALEDATNSWTNVNLQTYTPGTTSFAGNNKTGCTASECSTNTYTMSEHSGRARLITIPEAWNTGCAAWNPNTCPKYMHNYLNGASEHGGIVEGNEVTIAYWTMNAFVGRDARAWYIGNDGSISNYMVSWVLGGARAVVEINK